MELSGKLCFAANDENHGGELWRSDGTAAGTQLVKDIFQGPDGSDPVSLTTFGQVALFGCNSSWDDGGSLWKTNGTEAGTQEILQDAGDANGFTIAGGQAFCEITAQSGRRSLWVVNRAATAAAMVQDHGTGFIEKMTAFQDKLYYTPDDQRIWVSDGTPAGTHVVVDIWPYGGLNWLLAPADWTPLDDALYLTANDNKTGYELWKTTGDNQGTTVVQDIFPGGGSSTPDDLIEMNGALYFSARPASWERKGRELWKSDGTPDGTRMVKDILPGLGESMPQDLVKCGSVFFFTATTGEAGRELWRSNGTAAGTRMVKDIFPGPEGSCPHELTAPAGLGLVFFAAASPEHGVELWFSDGAEAGTRRVADINPGIANSNPGDLRLAGDNLFFRATSAAGVELWALDIADLRPRGSAYWQAH